MTYNPRSVFQSYEQYGRAKTRQAKASKPKNANQQAARTMRSAGIGGLGGRPTTSSAKQIQDRFRRETQRDTGLGSRKTQTSKDEDMSMGTKIDRAFVKVMTSLIPDFSPPKEQAVFPLQVYGGPLFTVPTPTPVDMQELDDAARDTARTFAPPSMDAPTIPTTATDSDTGLTTPKGLMSPPTMTQPEKPRGLMGIPRALARANAVPTAAYQVQSGDTLSEIAAATGTTVKELADLNQISDVDLIEAGADIQIPIKRLEDEAVVTQATSTEELKPIKASYTIAGAVGTGLGVDPDSQFYKSFRQGVMSPEEFEEALVDRLKVEEGIDYTAEKKFGEEYYTIGHGHYGPDVKKGQKISKKEADALLRKDIQKRLPEVKKSITNFDELSGPLQIEIVQSWFRGGIAGSPNTIRLINEGKFDEAAKEFLDHDEYEEAKRLGKKSGKRGIVARMEGLSKELKKEQYR